MHPDFGVFETLSSALCVWALLPRIHVLVIWADSCRHLVFQADWLVAWGLLAMSSASDSSYWSTVILTLAGFNFQQHLHASPGGTYVFCVVLVALQYPVLSEAMRSDTSTSVSDQRARFATTVPHIKSGEAGRGLTHHLCWPNWTARRTVGRVSSVLASLRPC